MKKIIIPIIIAAVLGIGGGVAAMKFSQTADAEEQIIIPELTQGNYYLNGDVESGLYLEVGDGYISLRGDNVYSAFKEWTEEVCPDMDAAAVESATTSEVEDYSTKNPYVIGLGMGDIPYIVFIHWSEHKGDEVGDNRYRYSGNGYWWNNETDTLNLSCFGDFILVED